MCLTTALEGYLCVFSVFLMPRTMQEFSEHHFLRLLQEEMQLGNEVPGIKGGLGRHHGMCYQTKWPKADAVSEKWKYVKQNGPQSAVL